MQGPAGIQGIQGLQGPIGPQGLQGVPGLDGRDKESKAIEAHLETEDPGDSVVNEDLQYIPQDLHLLIWLMPMSQLWTQVD